MQANAARFNIISLRWPEGILAFGVGVTVVDVLWVHASIRAPLACSIAFLAAVIAYAWLRHRGRDAVVEIYEDKIAVRNVLGSFSVDMASVRSIELREERLWFLPWLTRAIKPRPVLTTVSGKTVELPRVEDPEKLRELVASRLGSRA